MVGSRALRMVLRACAALAVLAAVAPATPASARPAERVPDEILVRFDPAVPDVVRKAAHAARGNKAVRSYDLVPGLELVRLAPGASVEAALRAYSGMRGVRYAEPNGVYHIAATPNDTSFGQLWGLHNTGQSVYYVTGTPDADIDAPEAWNTTTGSSSVMVAVIDTGVDYTHPDLVDNIWTNPGEIAGNGLDDDANGYVDDVHGWNAVANNGNPLDDHGHGTHCAGTIGATGNNGTGVVGVNWDVTIVAIKAGDASGSFSTANMIEGMQYAHAVGADVTSNSYGGWGTYSQSLSDAVAATGSLFVAAAGNDGMDISGSFPGGSLEGTYYPARSDWFYYPATFDLPNVLAVGATDSNDTRASFSSYSATKVDVFAPGKTIGSTYPGNSYVYMDGTSMATPHVAGVAALILSSRPTLGVTELKATIMDTVDPKAALAAYCVTGGRLNARGVIPPPIVADDDSYATAEDAPLVVPAATGVLVGDVDPEGDTLTTSRTGASGPSHGTLTLVANGSFTYTPQADYFGTDTFTYRAFDGALYSDYATVTITITPVNDPPSFTSGPDITVTTGSSAVSTPWATNVSPGPLETEAVTFEVTSDNAALFSVQPQISSTGTLSFTLAPAASGAASVSATLRDAYGLASSTRTFTVAVAPGTAPVLAAIGDKSVNERALLTFLAKATDADLPAQTLTFTLGGIPPVGAAITSGGTFTWTPSEEQGGASYPVTVVVSDGTLTDSETITVTVSKVNSAPVLAPIGNKSVTGLTQLAFTATATDVDLPAQPLTFSLGGTPPTGAAITTGGAFTWTPTAAQTPGSYSVTIVVSDGARADSETITVTVVAPVGNVPVYRFYNAALGTHFYTASASEKATVQNTLSHIYTFEGEAYRMNPAKNSATLYRFYKNATGTHFYTASATEKANVQLNLSQVYTYEGPAYNVSTAPAAGRITVYRFFHTGNGTHFYTASATERDNVRNTLSHIYNYEGPAFYVAQ